MARDYRVRHRTRQDIASVALRWRMVAGGTGKSFNVCSFVVEVLAKHIPEKLNFEFCEYDDLPEGACVTFNPLTLHVVKAVWEDAKLGKPKARHVIAHEIGHIVLHDDFAVAYSNNDEARPRYLPKEESAENQANEFADLLLVPDHLALRLNDEDTIAALCVVTDDTAARCLKAARDAKHPNIPICDGQPCTECGNFTVIRSASSTRCETCGQTKQGCG